MGNTGSQDGSGGGIYGDNKLASGSSSSEDTAFENFVKRQQIEGPKAFGLLANQCVVATYRGDRETVSCTLSPEMVQLPLTKDPANGNALVFNGVPIGGTFGWDGVETGDTLLHVAARRNHQGVCEYLLLCGASLAARNLKGELPSDVTVVAGPPSSPPALSPPGTTGVAPTTPVNPVKAILDELGLGGTDLVIRHLLQASEEAVESESGSGGGGGSAAGQHRRRRRRKQPLPIGAAEEPEEGPMHQARGTAASAAESRDASVAVAAVAVVSVEEASQFIASVAVVAEPARKGDRPPSVTSTSPLGQEEEAEASAAVATNAMPVTTAQPVVATRGEFLDGGGGGSDGDEKGKQRKRGSFFGFGGKKSGGGGLFGLKKKKEKGEAGVLQGTKHKEAEFYYNDEDGTGGYYYPDQDGDEFEYYEVAQGGGGEEEEEGKAADDAVLQAVLARSLAAVDQILSAKASKDLLGEHRPLFPPPCGSFAGSFAAGGVAGGGGSGGGGGERSRKEVEAAFETKGGNNAGDVGDEELLAAAMAESVADAEALTKELAVRDQIDLDASLAASVLAMSPDAGEERRRRTPPPLVSPLVFEVGATQEVWLDLSAPFGLLLFFLRQETTQSTSSRGGGGGGGGAAGEVLVCGLEADGQAEVAGVALGSRVGSIDGTPISGLYDSARGFASVAHRLRSSCQKRVRVLLFAPSATSEGEAMAAALMLEQGGVGGLPQNLAWKDYTSSSPRERQPLEMNVGKLKQNDSSRASFSDPFQYAGKLNAGEEDAGDDDGDDRGDDESRTDLAAAIELSRKPLSSSQTSTTTSTARRRQENERPVSSTTTSSSNDDDGSEELRTAMALSQLEHTKEQEQAMEIIDSKKKKKHAIKNGKKSQQPASPSTTEAATASSFTGGGEDGDEDEQLSKALTMSLQVLQDVSDVVADANAKAVASAASAASSLCSGGGVSSGVGSGGGGGGVSSGGGGSGGGGGGGSGDSSIGVGSGGSGSVSSGGGGDSSDVAMSLNEQNRLLQELVATQTKQMEMMGGKVEALETLIRNKLFDAQSGGVVTPHAPHQQQQQPQQQPEQKLQPQQQQQQQQTPPSASLPSSMALTQTVPSDGRSSTGGTGGFTGDAPPAVDLSKYRRLLRMGMPEAHVQAKMAQDGVGAEDQAVLLSGGAGNGSCGSSGGGSGAGGGGGSTGGSGGSSSGNNKAALSASPSLSSSSTGSSSSSSSTFRANVSSSSSATAATATASSSKGGGGGGGGGPSFLAEMQKRTAKKDSQMLVREKDKVLSLLIRIDESLLLTVQDTEALEAELSPQLEGLSLRAAPNESGGGGGDDWAKKLAIKKKGSAELHFSEEELARARRAQERWMVMQCLVAWSRRLGGSSTALRSTAANLKGSAQLVVERLEERCRHAVGAKRAVFDQTLNPTLQFELTRAKRVKVPHDLSALRREMDTSLLLAARDAVDASEAGLRLWRKSRLASLKRSKALEVGGTLEKAALVVAFVQDELVSDPAAVAALSGGVDLAALVEALTKKRAEVGPFIEQASKAAEAAAASDSDEGI